MFSLPISMAVRSGPFSAGWISTRLKKIDVAPRKVVVLMDTTYWVRGFGLMFFKDAHTRENLQWYYVKTETNRLYAKGVNELRPKGFNVMAICDGKKGLIGTFRDIPVQLCQFHQVATIRRYVTKNPKMPVSIDLKAHVAMLKNADRESFADGLQICFVKWERLSERAYHQS